MLKRRNFVNLCLLTRFEEDGKPLLASINRRCVGGIARMTSGVSDTCLGHAYSWRTDLTKDEIETIRFVQSVPPGGTFMYTDLPEANRLANARMLLVSGVLELGGKEDAYCDAAREE